MKEIYLTYFHILIQSNFMEISVQKSCFFFGFFIFIIFCKADPSLEYKVLMLNIKTLLYMPKEE